MTKKDKEEGIRLYRTVRYLVSDFEDISELDVLDYMIENNIHNPYEAIERLIKN